MSVAQSGARLVTPQTAVLAPGTRISTVPGQQQTPVLGPTRVVSTQPSVTVGRLSVASPASVSSANVLGPTRISTLNLHSLVAVANSSQARTIQTQGPKVITQPAQGNSFNGAFEMKL